MDTEIKAIIVEDMEAYLDTIEKLVNEVAPAVKVVGKAKNLSEAKKMIRELSPNLLFLDIQFEEEGSTAFDLLNEIGSPEDYNFRIIFITAHLEPAYYAEAFHLGALHFLEKPVDKRKLKEAIDRVFRTQSYYPGNWQDQLKQLPRLIKTIRSPGKIVVEGTKYNEVIRIDHIIILEASGRYTNITLSDGKTLIACQNLGEFEKKLNGYTSFCRIHHNKIINMNFVKRFSRKERIIELFPPYGNHIASKERMKDFLKFLEEDAASEN